MELSSHDTIKSILKSTADLYTHSTSLISLHRGSSNGWRVLQCSHFMTWKHGEVLVPDIMPEDYSLSKQNSHLKPMCLTSAEGGEKEGVINAL